MTIFVILRQLFYVQMLPFPPKNSNFIFFSVKNITIPFWKYPSLNQKEKENYLKFLKFKDFSQTWQNPEVSPTKILATNDC